MKHDRWGGDMLAMIIWVGMSLICFDQAMGFGKCDDVFKKENVDRLSVREMLERARIEYSDLQDFVVIRPGGSSTLNRVALWSESTLGRRLVLLTRSGYSLDREIETDDVMVIFWPKLLILLSTYLCEKDLQDTLWTDFRARRALAR